MLGKAKYLMVMLLENLNQFKKFGYKEVERLPSCMLFPTIFSVCFPNE